MKRIISVVTCNAIFRLLCFAHKICILTLNISTDTLFWSVMWCFIRDVNLSLRLIVLHHNLLFRHSQGPGGISTAAEIHSHQPWHVASPNLCKWVFRSPCSTPVLAAVLVRGDARHNTFTLLRDRRLNSHSSAQAPRLTYSICGMNPVVPRSQTKFSSGCVYYTVWTCSPAHNYSMMSESTLGNGVLEMNSGSRKSLILWYRS